MAKTKIEWCDRTWNPVSGCTKVSEGCKNCYAERMHTRLEHIKRSGYDDGKPHFSIRLHPERLEEPLKWKKPQRVFVGSMGDLFHAEVPFEFIDRIIFRAASNPQHTFLFLTKRPKRMLFHFTQHPFGKIWNLEKLKHLWFGVSVENQQTADERIPVLLQIPAAKRFLSIEPLLEPVDLRLSERWCSQTSTAHDCDLKKDHINWVILGGEPGPKARPMDVEWARSVMRQCKAANVPFFMKQMSKKASITEDLMVRELPE